MSLVNIAYSGLNAFSRALDVTANNISNATTKGYSRQGIGFMPVSSNGSSGFFVGGGVSVESIFRNVDEFANAQVLSSLSTKSQYDAFYQQAIQIDKLLSHEGTSISNSIQLFFNSLGQLNSVPNSISSRGVLMKQSELLVQQFNSMQQKLDDYQNNVTAQIAAAANQINALTKNIADINTKITSNPDNPDLLDSRDRLVNELSQFVNLSVAHEKDGSVTLGLSNGVSLVIGAVQQTLEVRAADTGTRETQILINNGFGKADITSRATTGMLGGLLDYERSVLGQSSQLIGQMAVGLAQTWNAQHRMGIDLNNQIGKDFFNDFNTPTAQRQRSVGASGNTGTAVLSVAITDISQTQLSDYQLIVSDTLTNEVRVIRKSDGSSTTLNWSTSPPAPPAGELVFDGLTLQVDDLTHLANNDSFSLSALTGAAGKLAMEIRDPREIALANPVRTSASLDNSGQGKIVLGEVLNTVAVNKQYRLDFTSATQYTLVNVTDSTSTGPHTFVPNTDNTIQIPDALNPSYSVIVSGIPQAGDQFTAEYNAGGAGDNRNGLSLLSTSYSKIFSGGSESLFEKYSSLLADVGGRTNQSRQRAESAEVLYNQSIEFQSSRSGVNLDEEGANLLKYKQAYEAAGKLLQISNQIMNVLFDIMR